MEDRMQYKEVKLRKYGRKIKRLEKRLVDIKDEHKRIKEKGGTLTEHAGWKVGYYQGQIALYETMYDDLEDEIKQETSLLAQEGAN